MLVGNTYSLTWVFWGTLVFSFYVFRSFHGTARDCATPFMRNIGLYIISLIHSLWITYVTCAYVLCSDGMTYATPFDKWSVHMIAISLGYYLSDVIEMVHTLQIMFILHHFATFYYFYITYAYNLGGLYVVGMAIAETTAALFNMRYIAYKCFPHRSKMYSAMIAVFYFVLRTIVGFYAIYECFFKYDVPWQPMVIPILITAVSTYWGICMLIQSYKQYRPTPAMVD